MKKIRLDLGERGYDIFIDNGTVARLSAVIGSLGFKGPVVVISDKMVTKKAKKVFKPAFEKLRNDICWIDIAGSESSKSFKTFREVVYKISGGTKMRRPLIVALGGGVTGDLAGFIAATYRRGVPFIQVPTTLLAQVDSSIGGKVGIDLPEAKNLIGSFKQPQAVLTDIDFLRTLPARQLRNGLAEIIKYGIIKSRTLFTFLEGNIDKFMSLDSKVTKKVIYECSLIKSRIVEEDEFDVKDIRIILNFGHTLGHAVEAAAGYGGRYSHGESVAIGMLLAGEIALRLDMFPEKEFIRMKSLIKSAGLPVRIENVPLKKIMNSYSYDKKFTAGTNRLVLPGKIGAVEVIEDIPEILINAVLEDYAR